MPITRTKTVMVLSIDGGGIRGIIPALILREIESRLKKAGKARPFPDIFHLIAGTSTGGIISLGLALPKSAEGQEEKCIPESALSIDDIIELYEKRGQEIFPQGRFNRLRTVAQMFVDKYDEAGIEKILDETFKKATLKDALTNLLVTSYETETMQPFCFKNRPLKPEWQDDENFYMRDAARATTAAPTYFIPARVDPVPFKGTFHSKENAYCFLDGGLWANNPALIAYIETTKIFPHAKKYIILSLGTGSINIGYSFDQIKDWGYLEWISPGKGAPLSKIMSTGQSEAVDHQLRRISNVEYFRINGTLEGSSTAMDDASRENIKNLKKVAARIIREHDRDLDALCHQL